MNDSRLLVDWYDHSAKPTTLIQIFNIWSVHLEPHVHLDPLESKI